MARRPHHERHSRYGSWNGGDDPLAPPFDVRAVVDELGQDVLAGSSFRDALQEMMRRGTDGRRGLDDIADRIRRRRDALRRRGDLSGTLAKVGSALDQAVATEQETLAGIEGDEARMAEMELDTLPRDTPGAVRALENYDWKSPEAKEIYDSIRQMLQHEVVDAQFEGMRNALSGNDPEAMQQVRDMLADLNNLLASHARGEDTTDQFNEFMDKHGDLFPENPQNTDELIDSLARRSAAADRMMRSLSPQQREELSQLMSDAMGDLDMASQMAQLRDNLRTLRPGMGQGPPIRMRGQEPLGYGDAVEAVADIADLEELARQLDQSYPGASLDDVDVEMIEQQLGSGVATDLRALRDLERELERQGYVSRGENGPQLTPRALRRLGETALKRVFADLQAQGTGNHDDHRTGSADEPTGQIRPWVFGDDLPVNAPATVRNAVMRTLAQPRGEATDPGEPTDIRSRRAVHLDVEDFAVAETERRTSTAVALCVDLSYSMIQEGRWGPMKQTALALSHLVSTRFRQDALQIIGFDLLAKRLSPVQLAEAEHEWVQGTNLQHALILAGRHLRRHPDAEPIVLVVTDGEPTAHLMSDGSPTFRWPTTTATLRATMGEVDALTRYGATLNFFKLGEDEGLARFLDAIARRNGGRVFSPDLGRLGEYVVSDYLRMRRGRRRSA